MGDIQICSGPGWSEILILRMATSTRSLDFSVLYLEKNGDLYPNIVFYASISHVLRSLNKNSLNSVRTGKDLMYLVTNYLLNNSF